MPKAEVPLDGLLERLRMGSVWLSTRNEQLYEADVTYDKEFDSLLHTWDELESSLRVVHDYEHCVFGEGQTCPTNTMVTCSACIREGEKGEA